MKDNPATVYSDSLYSLNSFIDEFSTICFPLKDGNGKGKEGKLSKRDMEVLLRWLNRDCGVIVTSGDVRPSSITSHPHSDKRVIEADGRSSKSYQKERGWKIILLPKLILGWSLFGIH